MPPIHHHERAGAAEAIAGDRERLFFFLACLLFLDIRTPFCGFSQHYNLSYRWGRSPTEPLGVVLTEGEFVSFNISQYTTHSMNCNSCPPFRIKPRARTLKG